MNTLGRILLLVGGLVLALLVGVLIGRGQRIEPISEEGNAQAVQITTAPPPGAPMLTPLPATVPPPQPAAVAAVAPVAKAAPDLQVQEDAAAVGMTTRDAGAARPADDAPAPKSAAGDGADPARAQPNG